ncbi:MAG: hypothetical protein ACE5F1_02930 [Planctomycetota bacterium]
MKYRLERVQSRRERRRFVDLPRRVLGTRPSFVPPVTSEEVKRIDPSRNPFFEHAESAFWILADERGPVGRISATVDRLALDWNEDETGVFGHILAPDEAGAAKLLDAARHWLRARGLRRMLGPIELSTNYTCGLQVSGFDVAPMIEMNQHPEGLEGLILAAGPEPIKDLLAFRVNPKKAQDSRIERITRISERRYPARIRPLDPGRFSEEVRTLHDIYERAWERNFGFVPMSGAEFAAAARSFKPLYDPELTLIAEHEEKPVAFLFVLPDINPAVKACNGRLFPLGFLKILRHKSRTQRARLLTFGLVPEARNRGLDARLVHEITKRTAAHGYELVELSWVLEDNKSIVTIMEQIGSRESTRYRLYEQAL